MNMRNPAVVIIISLAVLGAAGLIVQQCQLAPSSVGLDVDCEGMWSTLASFREATVDDVTVCFEAWEDLEARRGTGSTPLHLAARYNEYSAVIEASLAAGADPLARDTDGESPLHLAARYTKNPAVIETLLTAGADMGARNNLSHTPLHYAAEHNDSAAVG